MLLQAFSITVFQTSDLKNKQTSKQSLPSQTFLEMLPEDTNRVIITYRTLWTAQTGKAPHLLAIITKNRLVGEVCEQIYFIHSFS